MSNIKMTIKVKGLDKLKKGLDEFEGGLKDFSGIFRDLGKELIQFYSSKNFSTAGASLLGKTWKALSPRYRTWKSTHWPGRNILIQTGSMQRSFKDKAGRDSLIISNTSKLFPYHQLGTKKLPQRLMLGLNRQMEQDIKKNINENIGKKLKKSF
jgi:phage gpG-like protein